MTAGYESTQELRQPTNHRSPPLQVANENLRATLKRGDGAGATLRPHVYGGGFYVVSTSRFARDQKQVPLNEPLAPWLRQGFKLRMSPAGSGAGASLISPENIDGLDGSTRSLVR